MLHIIYIDIICVSMYDLSLYYLCHIPVYLPIIYNVFNHISMRISVFSFVVYLYIVIIYLSSLYLSINKLQFTNYLLSVYHSVDVLSESFSTLFYGCIKQYWIGTNQKLRGPQNSFLEASPTECHVESLLISLLLLRSRVLLLEEAWLLRIR